MSSIRNTPVIHRDKQIGFLQNVVLDDEQKRVQAFIVARGLKGKCLVPSEAVTVISGEFMIADFLEKYDRCYEKHGSFFAIDTDGLMIGKVSDYAIDEEALRICAIEVMRGYLPSERRDRIWFYSYSMGESKTREIIVPTFIQLSQCEWKEGEEACGSQP